MKNEKMMEDKWHDVFFARQHESYTKESTE